MEVHTSLDAFRVSHVLFVLGILASGLASPASATVSFTRSDIPVAGGPASAVAVDFNGDGILDLAVPSAWNDFISVLLGNGDGTFGPRRDFTTGSGPFSIAAGDINGDAIPDLLVANINPANVSVLLGVGDGTFNHVGDFDAQGMGGPYSPHFVGIADVNADGRPDAITASVTEIILRLGNGDGTFGPRIDLPISGGRVDYEIFAADFNHDGRLDLAALNWAYPAISVFLGNGNGTFQSQRDSPLPGPQPFYGDVADLNGDGHLDIVVSNYGSTVSVVLGRGDGTFSTATDFGTGSGPTGVKVGDFNLDGIPDIATAINSGNQLDVLTGRGDGTFDPKLEFPSSGYSYAVALGDWDRDGWLDVLVTDDTLSRLYVFRNTPILTGPPILARIADMAVTPGATADQGISATDPDGDAIAFTSSGPAFMSLTSNTQVGSTRTGNIHLAPSPSTSGTFAASVTATAGGQSNGQAFTIFVGNRPPLLAQPANMTVNEGTTADQALAATDPDGDPLTFTKVAGPTYMTVTTISPGTGTATGNVHLAPGFSDAGSYTATVSVTDPGSLSSSKSFSIQVGTGGDRAPTLNQPANMSVAPGGTADQTITGSDPDGDALTFSKVSGPSFMTVTTTTTTTGNVHLAPSISQPSGTSSASVSVSDGTLTDTKSFTVTVTGSNSPPVLIQPANMTVNEGATADQVLTGSDPDGDAVTFTKVAGPTFMMVTTTSPTTGNIHLAPGFADAGAYPATVRASDGALSVDKSFAITVNDVPAPPVLASIANMTVAPGATADQGISATDPDGDAITFTSSGPTFMTLTSNAQAGNTRTGNIHLAPPIDVLGTFQASVTATANGQFDDQVLVIRVASASTCADDFPAALSNYMYGGWQGPFGDGTAGRLFPTADGTGIYMDATYNGYVWALRSSPEFSDADMTVHFVLPHRDNTEADWFGLWMLAHNPTTPPGGSCTTVCPFVVPESGLWLQFRVGFNQLVVTRFAGGVAVSSTSVPLPLVALNQPHDARAVYQGGSLIVYLDSVQLLNWPAPDVPAGQVGFEVYRTDMIVDATNVVAGPGPPTLAAIANMTVAPGTTADQGISATDPDADAIIFTSSGPSFMTLTQDAQVGTTRTGNIHLAPPISTSGTFQASVTATANGQFDDQSFVITAHTNSPPTLNQPANMTVDEAATANQVLTGSDPDGDALTFTKVAGPTFMMVTTTNPTTGNVDLSPGFADAGTYPATVRASDGALSDDRSFAITVNDVPAPPVLAPIANMPVAPGTVADQGISATDPDADAITFTSSGPAFMTLTSNAQVGNTRAGTIHLAPPIGTLGTFQASVTATANGQFDDQAFLILVGTNTAPTLAQPANMTVNEGATADQSLNATDPNGDPLTFAKVSGPTYATVTTTTPGSGTGTGNVHLAPGFSDSGTASVMVRVSDGSLSNDKSFQVTINSTTRPPVLAQPANMTVAPGTTADQAISATVSDGSAITFTFSGPAFMTLTSNAQVGNTRTGNLHLAPPLGTIGTFSASVTATAGGLTSTRTFTINVYGGNQSPVLAQPANMTVSEGATADQSLTATDPDGNPLTFSKVSGPTYMTVTTTTPGAGTATGNIHVAPGFSDAGTASATVQVSDGSLTNSKSFTVTIGASNRPPVLNQPTNMTAREGATADQVLVGSDPDGDALTFSKVTGPFFMTVTTTNATSGNIHIAPPFGSVGVYPASVQASDGTLSNSKSFTITVVPASNRCPTANPGGPYTGLAGVPVNFDGTGSSDPDGDVLTYAWDFDASDGVGTDAVGSTTSHAYASGGAFVVTLAVSDGVCSNSATTSASILSACPATVFNGYDVIRLGSGKPFWFAYVQPASSCYTNTDVITSSFVLKYAGRQIPAEVTKTSIGGDKNGDGIQEIKVSWSKDNLRALFTGTGLANGDNLVTVTLEANLLTGGTLQGTTQVDVFNNGSFTAATVSPNPLNPQATLTFTTAQPGFAKVEIFDIGGRLVRTILDERSLAPGVHEVKIEGRGARGETLASGIYFIRGVSPEGEFTKTIAILK